MTHWIAMKDRKPSTDGMHLVYAPSADPTCPMIVTAWWHTDEQRWSIIIDYWARAVTHWQPLPEPPKESK